MSDLSIINHLHQSGNKVFLVLLCICRQIFGYLLARCALQDALLSARIRAVAEIENVIFTPVIHLLEGQGDRDVSQNRASGVYSAGRCAAAARSGPIADSFSEVFV